MALALVPEVKGACEWVVGEGARRLGESVEERERVRGGGGGRRRGGEELGTGPRGRGLL